MKSDFAETEAMAFGIHAAITTALLKFESAEVSNDDDRNDGHPAEQGGNEEVERTVIHTDRWRRLCAPPDRNAALAGPECRF